MFTLFGLLLVTNSAAAAVRGTILVPLPTPQRSEIVVGKDTLHTNYVATLGSCSFSMHFVDEAWSPRDTSRIGPFPGEGRSIVKVPFVNIGWRSWSTFDPGASCAAAVRQDSGRFWFRYKNAGDVLVLMDTVFFRTVDSQTVTGWHLRRVEDVRSRWSHAPYDPKRKWVRWVDSIDFVHGKTIPTANHPILTLIDSMAIDSIRPAKAAMGDPWNLRIDAVERSGRTWSFDLHSSPYRRPPANHGWGVVLPPGTTFRFQEWWEEGLSPRRNRVIHIWSKGKVIDSLIANPAPHQSMDVRRTDLRASSPSGAKAYDARGRRDRESAESWQGADNVTGAKGLEIRFGK